jgi:hypothetical protein
MITDFEKYIKKFKLKNPELIDNMNQLKIDHEILTKYMIFLTNSKKTKRKTYIKNKVALIIKNIEKVIVTLNDDKQKIKKLYKKWYYFFSDDYDFPAICVGDELMRVSDEYDSALYAAMNDITGAPEKMDGVWEYNIANIKEIEKKLKKYGIKRRK